VGDQAGEAEGNKGDEVLMKEWLDGRTVSETMVAMAGLNCQTDRGMRR
jgi:hypothetical protein